jgi:acyl-coenzyme A thioesterase PaaI-like protein
MQLPDSRWLRVILSLCDVMRVVAQHLIGLLHAHNASPAGFKDRLTKAFATANRTTHLIACRGMFITKHNSCQLCEQRGSGHSNQKAMLRFVLEMSSRSNFRILSLNKDALKLPEVLGIDSSIWVDQAGRSLMSVFYLGHHLCGYTEKIHGGILATMVDDCFARCGSLVLQGQPLLTANLNVHYRSPALPGNLFLLHAVITETDARKVWIEGRIESFESKGMKPTVVAEASGLFIGPNMAQARFQSKEANDSSLKNHQPREAKTLRKTRDEIFL